MTDAASHPSIFYNIIFYPAAVVPRATLNVFTKSYDQNARGRYSRCVRVSFNAGVNNTYDNNIIYKLVYVYTYSHHPRGNAFCCDNFFAHTRSLVVCFQSFYIIIIFSK